MLLKELCAVLSLLAVPCNPMDCSPPISSVHGDYPGKNTGAGCHALLQGIFPTQGLNPGIPHCKLILYCLSHQGSARILEYVAYPFCRGTSLPKIELASHALQVGSFPAELPGKPKGRIYVYKCVCVSVCVSVWSSVYSRQVRQKMSLAFPVSEERHCSSMESEC